jgi:hypothetical protein
MGDANPAGRDKGSSRNGASKGEAEGKARRRRERALRAANHEAKSVYVANRESGLRRARREGDNGDEYDFMRCFPFPQ